MAAVNRGQPPARHTKVVDSYPSPLKEDRPQKNSKPDSRPGNDVSLSKSSERSQTDETVGNTTTVYQCRKPRCKTCKHLREGDKFTSNVTGKTYSVQSRNQVMTCETKNVIYVISCCRCGIQYVGETSQMLRQRMNNHRSRLKKVGVQYLYKHYCNAGHSEDDITIMPIEEVDVSDKHVSSTSERLQREQYWYRELKCIQWNPSITATIGEWRFGPYREVAFREGSCFFLLFTCSSHISLHPVITLSSQRRRLHSLMDQDCNRSITETTIVSLNTLYIILSLIQYASCM